MPAIRAAVPEHHLVLATTSALEPLAALIDAVDEVLDRLHPARLLTFAAPGYPGPVWRPDEHEVRRWCRLVSEGLGVPAVDGLLARV